MHRLQPFSTSMDMEMRIAARLGETNRIGDERVCEGEDGVCVCVCVCVCACAHGYV